MEEYSFAGQEEGEEVVLVVKQHPWVMVKPILKILLVLTVTILAVILTLKYSSTMSWTYLLAIIGLLITIYIASISYFVWQNSVLVLTNQRIIIVDQNSWFNRMISETNLENILTINHVVKGPIRTLFNFGDLNIRASGVVEDEIIFYDVADPYNIQQAITKAQGGQKSNRKIETGEKIDEKLADKSQKTADRESQDFWRDLPEKKIIR